MKLPGVRAARLPIQQRPAQLTKASLAHQLGIRVGANRWIVPSAGGMAQQAGIGTLRPLLKVHGRGLMQIASLSNQQRLTAALATMQGDGLQGQAAQKQNRRATEGQGQGKAAAPGSY